MSRFIDIAKAAVEKYEQENGVGVADMLKHTTEFKKLFNPDYKGPRPGFRELVTANDFGILFQKVVTDMLQTPVEPEYIGVNLFTETVVLEHGTAWRFPLIGGLTAKDVPINMPVPEQDPHIALETLTIDSTRSGVAMSIETDLINDSTYDLVGYFASAGRKALRRHKEEKVWKAFEEGAWTVFDNASSDPNLWTSGTEEDGVTKNGSIDLIDLMDMQGAMAANGYVPTDFITSPLAWTTWHKDPVMLASFYHGGQIGGGLWSKAPSVTSDGSQSIFPWGVRYHSSRFVKPTHNTTFSGGLPAGTGAANVTNMYFVDRGNPLLIIQKNPVALERIETREIETIKLVMTERYGIFSRDLMRSAVQAKNIRLVQNHRPLFSVRNVAATP